jgi:hypothetical protein
MTGTCLPPDGRKIRALCGRASPEAAAKVAELEALQKQAAIAERLALQGGGKAGAPKPAAGQRGRSRPQA